MPPRHTQKHNRPQQGQDTAAVPDGDGGDVVIEQAAEHGADGAGDAHQHPEGAHVATVHVGRGQVGNGGGSGGGYEQLADGHHHDADPEGPEIAPERNAAHTNAVEQGAQGQGGEGAVLDRQAGDQELEEDHHAGVDRHQEAVLAFREVEVFFRIDSEEGKDQDGGYPREHVGCGEGDETPVSQHGAEEAAFFGLHFHWGLDFGLRRVIEGNQDRRTEEQQDTGCDVESNLIGRGSQEPADGWADGDARIVGSAHEGVGLQTFFRGQHIGHQGVGGNAIQADDQASYSHQDGKMGQGGSLAEEVEGESVHQQAEDHDRFAPKAVGKLTDERRGDQAAHRGERDQAGDGGQGHVQGFADVDGEEGPHHAGADGADQHAEEE